MNFHAMTEQEVLDSGMSPIVTDGQLTAPLDNQMVEELIATGNLPQTDKEGRPIISFSQYQRMRKKVDLSRYSMWMERPGTKGAWTMQASKYLKHFRNGYEAIGAPQEFRHNIDELMRLGMTPQAAQIAVRASSRIDRAPTVDGGGPIDTRRFFECRDKYPDCERFFDKAEGLRAHWGRDHGEWAAKRKPSAAVVSIQE